MEDACAVIDGFGGDGGTGFFGIYDGHGGRNVAEFIRLHLHVNVEKELRIKGERSVEECLKAAFSVTDMEASLTGEQASGSTAAVCVVRRQGPKRYVYTANCGDARAVLCHGGVAVRLSKDHKATDPQERARIEAAGGFVVRKRVMGVLAVARAFGDFVLKKFVTAEPYTSTTKLDQMVSTLLDFPLSSFVSNILLFLFSFFYTVVTIHHYCMRWCVGCYGRPRGC
jgi:serine/threonine protein phosphatase PrpC